MMQSMVTSQFNGSASGCSSRAASPRGVGRAARVRGPGAAAARRLAGRHRGLPGRGKEPQIFTFVSPDDGGVREIRAMPQSSKMYVEQIYEMLRGATIPCIREPRCAHDHTEFATARQCPPPRAFMHLPYRPSAVARRAPPAAWATVFGIGAFGSASGAACPPVTRRA